MKQLIECVPNFSEGRDLAVIKQITDAIEALVTRSRPTLSPDRSPKNPY